MKGECQGQYEMEERKGKQGDGKEREIYSEDNK